MSNNTAVATKTVNQNTRQSFDKTEAQFLAETKEQEKFIITLPKVIPGSPNEGPKRIQINGVIWQAKRGIPMPVCESVYQVLVASGEIPPQREEDMDLQPQTTWLPSDHPEGGMLIDQQARRAATIY